MSHWPVRRRPMSHHEPHHEHVTLCHACDGQRRVDFAPETHLCVECKGYGEIALADCDCDECAATYPAWFAAPGEPDTGLPDRAED